MARQVCSEVPMPARLYRSDPSMAPQLAVFPLPPPSYRPLPSPPYSTSSSLTPNQLAAARSGGPEPCTADSRCATPLTCAAPVGGEVPKQREGRVTPCTVSADYKGSRARMCLLSATRTVRLSQQHAVSVINARPSVGGWPSRLVPKWSKIDPGSVASAQSVLPVLQ